MNEIADQPSNKRNLKKSFRTFLICLAVGPPAGAIYAILIGFLYIVYAFVTGADVNHFPGFTQLEKSGASFAMLFVIGLIGIPASYVYGGIPAAVGGLLLGCYCYFFGRPSFWVPLAILAVPFLWPFLNLVINGQFELYVIATIGLLNLGIVFAAFASWIVVVRTQFPKTT